MRKKFKVIAMVISMMLVFTACGSSKGSASGKEENKDSVVETPKTMVVSDLLGREVEVPTGAKSILALGAGGLRMICYAGAQDLVVGVEEGEHKEALAKCYNYVYFDKFKDLPIVGKGGSGSYEAYEEEILNLNPDIIFAAYPEDLANDLQSKTGIPVVVITYDSGMFDEKLYESMDLIGKILNREDRCNEVVNSLKEWKSDLTERTANIKEEEKPSVYTGACSFKGGHGIEGTYTQFPPFTAIGAKNVADELSDKVGGKIIDLEQIATWDPDYIFLDPNNMKLVNDDYATNANFYNSLKAVKEGKVYTQVAYNWYTTNVETAVVDAYYAGKIIFPDKFKDVEIEDTAKKVYKTLLGEEAEGYYESLVEGGLGWRQLKLGEE